MRAGCESGRRGRAANGQTGSPSRATSRCRASAAFLRPGMPGGARSQASGFDFGRDRRLAQVIQGSCPSTLCRLFHNGTMILCRHLTRRFGEFTAVDSLSFEVASGAICAFLGPNGAGKSTTVKMLTGLLAPSAGEVRVCGLDPTAAGLDLKRRIGVLPEDLGLFDDLTVEEHLLLTGDIYGVPRAETR